jgi:uncharacterized protein
MSKFEERVSVELENEGQKIFGLLHLPLTQKKVPAVLICHGLAGHKTGKYRLYVSLAKSLAKAGIASLRIDFRGSGDSEGDFLETTVAAQVADALEGLNFLKSNPHVDKERLGIFGRSFGGAISVLAAERSPQIKSIALWAPMYNSEQWKELWSIVNDPSIPEVRRDEIMRVNGQQGGMKFFDGFFKIQLDPQIQTLSNIPMLHIQAENDGIISIAHAEGYKQSRKFAQAESKFIRLTKSDHDFSDIEEQLTAIQETTQWFLNTL